MPVSLSQCNTHTHTHRERGEQGGKFITVLSFWQKQVIGFYCTNAPSSTISTAPRCCLFEDAASISEELIHLSSFMSALGECLQQWPGPAGSRESGSPGVTHSHTCHAPCYDLTTPLSLLSRTTMRLNGTDTLVIVFSSQERWVAVEHATGWGWASERERERERERDIERERDRERERERELHT